MRARALALLLVFAGAPAAQSETPRTAILAGGCFWCVESDFDSVDGVLSTVSGYTGGRTENPTYRQVVSGGTGHLEAVAVTYDADKIDYETLLRLFWRSIDPTDAGGMFCDRGESYTGAIFVADAAERAVAETTKAEAQATLGQPVVTAIREAVAFYPAEDYHQDYYRKNPVRYAFYRRGCGRDSTVEALWGEEAAFAGKH